MINDENMDESLGEDRARRVSRRQRAQRLKETRRRRLFSVLLLGILSFFIGVAFGWWLRGLFVREPVDLSAIKAPDWIDQQFLTVNPYSRPGDKLYKVNDIVVHYIGNPGTTAQQNRNYFENLANQSGDNTTSASSNFIIGMDGEIIQCIPVDEKSYASNNRNSDTVSIECCHPDATGKFTDETYASLVKLTAWLCDELDLTEKNVIRHYDITGKKCPLYFVDHEDAWKQFLKDVKKER